MRIATKPISHHRPQRFHRWAMLWLSWFAAFLEAAADFGPLSKQACAIGHRWLDRIERLIVCIIIMRVTPYVRGINKRKGPSPHRRIDTSLFRAIVDGHMRRLLRSKHLHQRIAALRQNIDSLVARVLRRLPCGLTRRRPINARPEQRSADAHGVCSTPTVCADTSWRALPLHQPKPTSQAHACGAKRAAWSLRPNHSSAARRFPSQFSGSATARPLEAGKTTMGCP